MATPLPKDGQLGRPRGPFSPLLGRLMRRLNHPMNHLAVELLELEAADRVLEVGFGPGDAMFMMYERLPDGQISGIDHSPAMVKQAQRRNAAGARSGTVDARQGEVSKLPFGDAEFDKICAVNTHQFWPSPRHDLAEINRVMKPDGVFVLGIEVEHPDQKDNATRGAYDEARLDTLYQDLYAAGFIPDTTVVDQIGKVRANCIIVRKRTADAVVDSPETTDRV